MAQSAAGMHLDEVTNGFRPLLPHRIHALDGSGNPTNLVIEIRQLDDLIDNATAQNPVLPLPSWPVGAVLPSGAAGNHFLVVRFDSPLDLDSVLDSSPAAAGSFQLTGAIGLTAFDPVTGTTWLLPGRAFVGGGTYAGTPSGSPPALPGQRWVTAAGGGIVANPSIDNDSNGVPDGLGFPGTEPGSGFDGDQGLIGPDTFVFVADTDGDLTTHETFPGGLQIVISVSEAVRARDGASLAEEGRVSATVGPDILSPEIGFTPPPGSVPLITPGNGDLDVDPLTEVTLTFSESVQPSSFGTLTGAGPATVSAAVALVFGPPTKVVNMPYTALPVSPFDLTKVVLTPGFPFPGSGPSGPCGDFNHVDIAVNPGQTLDLSANANQYAVNSFFVTGEGPGITNAPVAPDAIYIGVGGAAAGLSVIDLNGFGASTGDPTYDVGNPVIEGNSNYPNNPNVRFQGSMLRPPLAPGACTVDGGSSGVLTRTRDSSLDPLLARAPYLANVSDLALGHPLDTTFNNGPAPFGCQAGGGNLCVLSGLQVMEVVQSGPNTVGPPSIGGQILNMQIGSGNPISWAPHPNPPALIFPPLCLSPFIGGQESTSIDSIEVSGLINLLVPGDPFGIPSSGIPPSGLLNVEQNAWYEGPSPPQTSIPACREYTVRQQVGHFLYVIDRQRRELVILNSNRMTPIDRIAMSDPVELATGPNLGFLAVTNQLTGLVSFVDINPHSATFHQVVVETQVGRGPRGIAWDSLNEDVLVCNEGDGTVSVISAFSLSVRKVVSSHLSRPFAIAITPRQDNFGWQRSTYYGYILNRDGSVAIFESGPDGVNGFGYDDIIGVAPYLFQLPKAVQVDPTDLRSGVWIVHEGKIDVSTGSVLPPGTGALTHLYLDSSITGVLPLQDSVPKFRQMLPVAQASLGEEVLTGIPVDLAFDDLRNLGALRNYASSFSAGFPALVNGKSLVRTATAGVTSVSAPRFLFAAVPNSASLPTGAVDVVSLANHARFDTNAFHDGVQSIPAPGAKVLMDYFRQ